MSAVGDIDVDRIHRLLAVLHGLDDQAMDRREAVDEDAPGPLQSEEIVLVLVQDQARALDCERQRVPLTILGRARARG